MTEKKKSTTASVLYKRIGLRGERVYPSGVRTFRKPCIGCRVERPVSKKRGKV